ncbi:metallophosphoesterase [Peptoniphilus sp. MSJ-1]|uniref:Metallophosphoesterase n=1 Tax=Peptoniphilus ovalis TaxID=2841503 RepID=A0ABS6FIS8_9FIRM|nr:metallophosphoesterase [Peptoniphilus ovalis]MBU5669343.1 metallophosphoesterase [Peptoniphilus ovalis]
MIYAIGDLHFDYSKEKPMDVFGENWIDHEEKIINNWKKRINEEDLVLLPGDISWALKLKDSIDDLKRIDNLPGKKIISKGNHDYWWSSLNKMNNLGFESIEFLFNNSFEYKDYSICGTRGWASRDSFEFNENDEKIYLREVIRLENSLKEAKNKKIIAMIHYPPFNQDFKPNEFSKMLSDYGVEKCVYGHLHGQGHKYRFQGEMLGVEYQFVASDFLNFDLDIVLEE